MTEQTSWKNRLRPLFIGLSLLSLSWVIYILWDAFPGAKKSLADVNIYWMAASLLGFVAGGYVVFEAFNKLFSWRFPNTCSKLHLGNLFFSSQLMKHIPGRVWGVAYQAMMASEVKASDWVAINIVYMALTSFFAVFVAAIILIFPISPWASLITLATLSSLYFFGWSKPVVSLLTRLINKISLRKLENLATALLSYSECNSRTKINIYITLFFSWLTYYSSWGVFGIAWPSLTFVDGILLCSIYTIAWFVGYISIATPSGLGVRELVFISLSSQFPTDAVAGMVIFGRLALLFADVTLGVLFLPFSKNTQRK
jgi:hypothetical protein